MHDFWNNLDQLWQKTIILSGFGGIVYSMHKAYQKHVNFIAEKAAEQTLKNYSEDCPALKPISKKLNKMEERGDHRIEEQKLIFEVFLELLTVSSSMKAGELKSKIEKMLIEKIY